MLRKCLFQNHQLCSALSKDEVNWMGLENLNIRFCQIFDAIVKISFLQGKVDTGLCLEPSEIFLIFSEFLGSQD